jgi:hypothetical protein
MADEKEKEIDNYKSYCPSCGAKEVIMQNGCMLCLACFWSPCSG